jgi:hypothetical protein
MKHKKREPNVTLTDYGINKGIDLARYITCLTHTSLSFSNARFNCNQHPVALFPSHVPEVVMPFITEGNREILESCTKDS